MQAARQERVPREALIGAAALLAFTVGAAAYGRLDPTRAGPAVPVATRALLFQDAADGAVVIRDAERDLAVGELAPGSNGFARGALRGLARERKRRDVGPEIPFLLVRRADGGLSLEDPATARTIDLSAFGPVNVAPFARLMTANGAAP